MLNSTLIFANNFVQTYLYVQVSGLDVYVCIIFNQFHITCISGRWIFDQRFLFCFIFCGEIPDGIMLYQL